MDRFGYQDLLSKCILGGLPEGRDLKSSSRLEVNAEPPAGAGRFSENPVSGSKEDTSGAAEADVRNWTGSGIDGTAVEQRSSQELNIPKGVSISHMLGKPWRAEAFKIDGVPRSLLTSGEIGTNFRADVLENNIVDSRKAKHDFSLPVFSFRSLLEGAVCVRSPNTTQSSVGLDNQGVVLHVEHQNCTFLAENRALPDQRRLLGEGNSAICAGSPASPCRRDQKILLVEVMTESSKGQNTALCSHDSGLLNGATVGDSVPHVSYSSLLQAQLSESVLKTRTGAFYKKPRDVERHSLLVNLQSQSAAVNGRFLSLMTQTNPVLPSDAELVDEKTSDIRRSKETSRDISVHDSRSADNVSGRNTSDLLETATVPVSLVLTRTEEDPARSNFVVKFASPLMADPIYTDEDMLDACISLEPSDSLSLNDSRLVGRASKRVAMEYSHAPPVTAPPVSKPSNAEAAQADNVMELANSLVNDSTCINEGMLDAHLPRGSSNAPDLDEARLVDNLVETDYIDSSEVAAVPASSMLTRKKQVVLPAEVLADPASSVVSESTCIVEEVSDLKRFEELSRGFALEVLRFPDNVANGDILDLSRRVDAPSTLVMVDRASFFGADCVLVDSTLDVQSPEEPSQRLGMEESRSTELVLVMEGMNPSAAAEVTASHVSSGVEDVPPGEVAVKKGPGLCEDSVISTEQGKHHLNVNCILNGSPSVNPSHGLVLDKRQQAPLEPLDIESLRAPGQFNSVSEETLFESFCQAGLNQSGYTNEDSVEVSRDNVCGNQIKRRTSSVLRKYGTDYLDASRFRTSMGVHASVQGPVVEKPADLPNDEILRFKENNTHSLNAIIAVVDFPLFLHSDGQGVDRERQFVPGFVESATFHVGGRADLVDIGTVVECSLEAGLKQTENVEALLEEQEDDREREIQTPSSAGNVASQSGADINFHYITLEEELNVSKDKILHTEKDKDYLNMYALVKKSSSFTPLNVGILPFSDSKVVEQGLGFTRIGSDSQEFSLLEPVSEKLCALYEVERSHEAHVGKIVNDVTESGNSGVLADQLVSTDPGAISSRQRQVFLQDSDPTMSGSLESVQVTGAESGATRQQTGRSVQSSQGKKFKEIHLDDLGDRDANQHNDHFRHLDDLEDNEEQPYASPLIVAVNHQLAGAEVRAQKKKRRPRAHNLEKALQGTGNSHFRISGSKRKRGLHIQRDGGNRCRRNQHIDLDHPVPVFIEGRDEGFEETDRSAFLRWLLHQDEGNGAPSPTTWKRPRRNGREMKKPIIVIPSFRVVADYEGRQQAVENQQKLKSSIHENVAISSTARQSDYDMDDEDERWLHSWNKRLAAAGSNQPISEDKFEEIIELLERSAQLEATPTVDDLGQPVSGGTLPNTSPSDINPATSGVPVLENAPTLSTSTVRSGHHPQTGGRQKISTSSIRYDCLGGVSTSPTSAVRFHSWTSKNEKIICKTVADTVIKRPSERLLQKSFEPLSQKSTDDCCVCNEGENDKNNPVYTCKNCFMHVHQSCYGIREKFRNDQGRIFAPPNWFCRICEAVAVGVAKPNVSCVLCRKRGGALKQTVSPQKWAHVACALYTPETFFVDPDAMEPIDGIVTVVARAQERQDRCGLCGAKKGICSLCSVKDCRVPFHISCGVSQGASFESRKPKQKGVGVRSFCPRHAHITSPLKVIHMVSSNTNSEAIPSVTARGSISAASSMDHRKEDSSWQNISPLHENFVESTCRGNNPAIEVNYLTDNVTSNNGKGIEDAGRPKGIRLILKRGWDEACTQVSEDGISIDRQEKSPNETVGAKDKFEAQAGKSTWPVVESGQRLENSKLSFGKLSHDQDSESFRTFVQHESENSEDQQPEKRKENMAVVDQMAGDAAVLDNDSKILRSLTEERFAKEVKELIALEAAMKSGVAPSHFMRGAFVYWRAKRAEHDASLLCDLRHEQWFKSQGIFNKDATVEENVSTGKMGSPSIVLLTQELHPMSSEKILERAWDLRKHLERLRIMSELVVKRENLKYNQQVVLGTIASVELNKAENFSRERCCVWCPSTKTLLKCETCSRSYCYNCFKHRKGFGVKGWKAAMKQPVYSCNYCRELSAKIADLSTNMDLAPNNFVDSRVISTSTTTSKSLDEGRGKGVGKGRDKAKVWQRNDKRASCRPAEGGVIISDSKLMDMHEDTGNEQRTCLTEGNICTEGDNAGTYSPTRGGKIYSSYGNRVSNQGKIDQLDPGLKTFLNGADGQMGHSSFESTLRRLNILQCRSTEVDQDMATPFENPSNDMEIVVANNGDLDHVVDREESGAAGTDHCGHRTGLDFNAPGAVHSPALLVYKTKRRFILGMNSESPPSAYDISIPPSSP